MRNVIVATIVASLLSSVATAGNYKLGHSQEGYDNTYTSLVAVAGFCGSFGMLPFEGPAGCGAGAVAFASSKDAKVHLKKSFRDKLKKAGYATMASTAFPLGPQAGSGAIAALATAAAMELHDEMGAKSMRKETK